MITINVAGNLKKSPYSMIIYKSKYQSSQVYQILPKLPHCQLISNYCLRKPCYNKIQRQSFLCLFTFSTRPLMPQLAFIVQETVIQILPRHLDMQYIEFITGRFYKTFNLKKIAEDRNVFNKKYQHGLIRDFKRDENAQSSFCQSGVVKSPIICQNGKILSLAVINRYLWFVHIRFVIS